MASLSQSARLNEAHLVEQAVQGDECAKRNAQQVKVKGFWKNMRNIFSSKTCRCPDDFLANEHCPEADIGKEQFSLSKKTSSQCKCEDSCKLRNAKAAGKSECECPHGLFANEHCGETSIGDQKFYKYVPKETSDQCKCVESECAKKYGGSWQFWENGQWKCHCGGLFPHALCGMPWGPREAFPLSGVQEGCRCLEVHELEALRPKAPVKVAALNFCIAFWKRIYLKGSDAGLTQAASVHLRNLAPEMCEKVVAEGQHQGFGRLDPLAPLASGTALHQHLQHVCHDECKELVGKMKDRDISYDMTNDLQAHGSPFAESCADRVVRQVEADILGCCAQSCQYNGRSCLAWPFFTKPEKIVWMEECCTEYNILNGSRREAMCNSVLTPDQVSKVSAFDVKMKKGVDVGEPYTGQGPLLLWTEDGVRSELGRYYAKSLHPPKPNSQVLSQVMEEHPGIRALGLKQEWFKEKNILAVGSERRATSFMEASGEECDVRHMTQCTATFQDLKVRSCLKQKKWRVSPKVQEKDEYEDGCPKGNPQQAETPEQCLTAFQSSSDVKSFFFEFKTQDDKPLDEDSPATPIKCFVETKEAACDAGYPRAKQLFQDLSREDLQLEQLTFWLAAEDL